MNLQSGENPGLNLPPPMAEQGSNSAPSPEQAAVAGFEQAPPSGQKDPTRTQPATPTIPLPPPPASPTAHTPPGDQTAIATAAAPLAADDNDLIEKEWVNKAKEIVERTRENPYQQSKELNLFKADYMKKRYNKTLRLSE